MWKYYLIDVVLFLLWPNMLDLELIKSCEKISERSNRGMQLFNYLGLRILLTHIYAWLISNFSLHAFVLIPCSYLLLHASCPAIFKYFALKIDATIIALFHEIPLFRMPIELVLRFIGPHKHFQFALEAIN